LTVSIWAGNARPTDFGTIAVPVIGAEILNAVLAVLAAGGLVRTLPEKLFLVKKR
jgi:hypothetical protein